MKNHKGMPFGIEQNYEKLTIFAKFNKERL